MMIANIRNDTKEIFQSIISTIKKFAEEMGKIVKSGKINEQENVDLMFSKNKKYTLTGKELLPKDFKP